MCFCAQVERKVVGSSSACAVHLGFGMCDDCWMHSLNAGWMQGL